MDGQNMQIVQMDGWMDGWIDRQFRQMGRWMDGWIGQVDNLDGWMDGWMDRQDRQVVQIDGQMQWRTKMGGLGCSNPPRNSDDIGGVLDRTSKKKRRLDFLLQFTVFSQGCNLLNKGLF